MPWTRCATGIVERLVPGFSGLAGPVEDLGIAARDSAGDGFTLRGAASPETVFAVQATPQFLLHSRRQSAASDAISTPGKTTASGPHVAILTHSFWKSRFHGDPRGRGALDSA